MRKFQYFFWISLIFQTMYASDWVGSPLGIPSYFGKLHQIKSDRFTLIFDAALHPKLAKLYAFFLEKSFESLNNTQFFFSLYKNTSPSKKPKKFSIILSQHSSTGNSYVNHGNQRAFLELHPPGPSSSLFPWEALVAMHEVRHILQSQVLRNSSLYKNTRWALGPFYAQMYAEMGLPYWFTEGDAVLWESQFSFFGRGYKEPFLKKFLLTVKNKKKISYFQDVMQSRVSSSWGKLGHSPYVMGYFFSRYFLNTYGYETYTKILDDTIKKPSWGGGGLLPLFGFEIAVLRHTKIHLHNHYKKMVKEIQSISIFKEVSIDTKPILQKKIANTVRSDFIPLKQLPQKSLLAFQLRKFGLNRFVEILPNGTIKHVKTIFANHSEIPLQGCIKMGTKYILMAEDRPHFRWGNHNKPKYTDSTIHGRNTTDLVLYEYPSWKRYPLLKNRKIISFALAPNDQYVVFIEQKNTGEKQVMLLEISTKKQKILLDGLVEQLVQYPVWSANSDAIFFLQHHIADLETPQFQIIKIDPQHPVPQIIHQMGVPFFPLTASTEYLFYSIDSIADPGIFAININNPQQIFKIADDSFFYSKNILLLSRDEANIFLVQPIPSKYQHIHIGTVDKKNWIRRKEKEVSAPVLNSIKKIPFLPNKFAITKYNPSLTQLAIPISWGIFSGELPSPGIVEYSHFDFPSFPAAAYGIMLITADQIGSLHSKWKILFHPKKYILSESISIFYNAMTPSFRITLMNQNQIIPKRKTISKGPPIFKDKQLIYYSGSISLIFDPTIHLSFRIRPGIYQLQLQLPTWGTIIYNVPVDSHFSKIPPIFYTFRLLPKIRNSFFFVPYGSQKNYIELSLQIDTSIRLLENLDQPKFLLRDPLQFVNQIEDSQFLQKYSKEQFQLGTTVFFGSPGLYKYDRIELTFNCKQNLYLETQFYSKAKYVLPLFVNWSLGPVIGWENLTLSFGLTNQQNLLTSKSPTLTSKFFWSNGDSILQLTAEPKFLLLPVSRGGVSISFRFAVSCKLNSIKNFTQPLLQWGMKIDPFKKSVSQNTG